VRVNVSGVLTPSSRDLFQLAIPAAHSRRDGAEAGFHQRESSLRNIAGEIEDRSEKNDDKKGHSKQQFRRKQRAKFVGFRRHQTGDHGGPDPRSRVQILPKPPEWFHFRSPGRQYGRSRGNQQ
jgi:hypothetical protein